MNDILKIINEKNNSIKKEKRISVSSIIHNISNEFDKELQSQRCFEKYYNDPNSKYYNKTKDDILKLWEEKSTIGKTNGSLLDKFIDFYTKQLYSDNFDENNIYNFLDAEEYHQSIYNKCLNFKLFYENYIIKNNINFIGNEIWMIDDINNVIGRLDALFMYKDELLVIDWKQNETISIDNKFQHLLGPLNMYDDCDLNKYTIQVYLYKFILSNIYKFNNIIVTRIIQLLDNGTKYKIFKPIIPYSDNLVIDIINYSKNKILNKYV